MDTSPPATPYVIVVDDMLHKVELKYYWNPIDAIWSSQSVLCSVVIAAELGTELGHVADWVLWILATSIQKAKTIDIKLTKGVLLLASTHMDWILGICWAILGN